MALARTTYDEAGAILKASAPGHPDFEGAMDDQIGRSRFATWLKNLLGEEAHAELKVLQSPGYRFMDHPKGHVSIVNLASVRDLGAKMGVELDPLRFRANFYVEGWPAW